MAKIPLNSYFVLSACIGCSGKADCNLTPSANRPVCCMMKFVVRSYAWDFRNFRSQGHSPYLPLVLSLPLVIIHLLLSTRDGGLCSCPQSLPLLCVLL